MILGIDSCSSEEMIRRGKLFQTTVLRKDFLVLLVCYGAIAAVWLLALRPLMIVDVWDESNIFIILHTLSPSLPDRLVIVWSQYLGLYRPLAATVLLLLDGLGFGTMGMRYFNALLLLVAFGMLSRILQVKLGRNWRSAMGFSFAALCSAGALITSTWFANVFDACCLVLIALGTSLLARERFLAAGFLFGLAFFCKEIAILSIPLALWVMARIHRLSYSSLLRCFVPLLLLAFVYFWMRQRLISIGTAGDIHQFATDAYWHSLLAMSSGFWWQTTGFDSGSLPGVIGLLVTFGSVLILSDWRDRVVYLTLLLLTSLACWGMFFPKGGVLISSAHFIGRLFLIPGTLALFVIASGHSRVAVWLPWLLAIPLSIGAILTGSDHVHFQKTYVYIYDQAAISTDGRFFTVNFGDKELNDPMRRLRIGTFPEAEFQLSPKDGCLSRRNGTMMFCGR